MNPGLNIRGLIPAQAIVVVTVVRPVRLPEYVVIWDSIEEEVFWVLRRKAVLVLSKIMPTNIRKRPRAGCYDGGILASFRSTFFE